MLPKKSACIDLSEKSIAVVNYWVEHNTGHTTISYNWIPGKMSAFIREMKNNCGLFPIISANHADEFMQCLCEDNQYFECNVKSSETAPKAVL